MTIIILVGVIIVLLVAGVSTGAFSLIKKYNPSMEPKTKAIDIFTYLAIFITLVTSVTNIIQILFAAIERKFTDVIEMGQYVDVYGSDMRMAIAMLIVVFPIYLALSMYVSRDIKKFTYKRDLLIRRVFIYTTLFATAVALVGSLVATIYTFLGGELTIRFGLKTLTVFAIAAAVGGYYLYALRRDYSKETQVPNIIAAAASLFVIVSLVWSISIIGTPAEMRLRRIDDTRLSDVSRIQQEIFNHFQTTDRLPASLSELDDAFQGYVVPKDPVSGESYEYRVIQQPTVRNNFALNKKELVTPGIFEVCATFATERKYNDRGGLITPEKYSMAYEYYRGDTSPFWNHEAGRTCFQRTITADMYYGGR